MSLTRSLFVDLQPPKMAPATATNRGNVPLVPSGYFSAYTLKGLKYKVEAFVPFEFMFQLSNQRCRYGIFADQKIDE